MAIAMVGWPAPTLIEGGVREIEGEEKRHRNTHTHREREREKCTLEGLQVVAVERRWNKTTVGVRVDGELVGARVFGQNQQVTVALGSQRGRGDCGW